MQRAPQRPMSDDVGPGEWSGPGAGGARQALEGHDPHDRHDRGTSRDRRRRRDRPRARGRGPAPAQPRRLAADALLGHDLPGRPRPRHRGQHRRPLDQRLRGQRPLRPRRLRPARAARGAHLDVPHRDVLRAAARALHPDHRPARPGGERVRAACRSSAHDPRGHRRPVLRRAVHRPVPLDLREQRVDLGRRPGPEARPRALGRRLRPAGGARRGHATGVAHPDPRRLRCLPVRHGPQLGPAVGRRALHRLLPRRVPRPTPRRTPAQAPLAPLRPPHPAHRRGPRHRHRRHQRPRRGRQPGQRRPVPHLG